MNLEVRQSGQWARLWTDASVAGIGSKYGYSKRDIENAIDHLLQIYPPDWVQKHPRHPIVVSLFAPNAMLNFLQVMDLGYAIAKSP